MWQMVLTLATNLGVSFEHIISIVVLLAGLIFYAKDFKLGVILHFFAFGLVFMWFYAEGLNFVVPLVLFFMSLVLMSLTLYFVSKTSQAGGFI